MERALDPATEGVSKALFTACVGIVLLQVVEAGFIISGHVGTGILLKKDPSTHRFSNPSACGLAGAGWGALAGGSLKDVMVFILDPQTLDKIAYDKLGLKVGAQGEATLGPLVGRTYQFDANLSEKGFGTTISVAFTRGAFVGLSIEGGILGCRHGVNETFYGRKVTPTEIFDGSVEIPTDKVTVLDRVHEKLDKLVKGETRFVGTPMDDPMAANA